MSGLEEQVYEALKALDRSVKSLSTQKPPPDLLPLLRRIDELGSQLPPGTDPQLLHFLQRRSFEKALLWLEGRKAEITRGICGNGSE
jgi:hypothetical protein